MTDARSGSGLIAAGFFTMAGTRLLWALLQVLELRGDVSTQIIPRLPSLGSIVGGILIAIGWAHNASRRDVRGIAIAASVAASVVCLLSLALVVLLGLRSNTLWIVKTYAEIGTSLLTLIGVWLWQRTFSGWIIATIVALAVMVITLLLQLQLRDGTLRFAISGLLPMTVWMLTALAALPRRQR